MIKVLDVNKATLSLFGAKTKEELLIGLKNVFTEYSYIKFLEELVAIAEGKTYMECEDIARMITDLHNGQLWVVDNPVWGAVFIMEMPKS